MSLKTLEIDLKICFVEHILDTMMNGAPGGGGFLCILGIKYMIGKFFSFSVILKRQRLLYSVFPSIISSQLLLALQ